MTTTDKEKIDMNTAITTNQRLVTILLVLLIILLVLLVIGIVAGLVMMGWGMMNGGMMGMGGMMTNDMSKACLEMMRNVQICDSLNFIKSQM